MDDVFAPNEAAPRYDRSARRRTHPRPDRFALWAVVMAVIAMFAGVATADAASGGISPGGDRDGRKAELRQRYSNIWEDFSRKAKRWARRTSECESGGDPNAIGGGGMYRGAFQFMRETWRNAPKSPGGDPIDYTWRTQAVVAVKLKRRDGAGHWPVCG